MDDMFNQALELVKAQATVRPMTSDEILSMIGSLVASLQGITQTSLEPVISEHVRMPSVDVAKSIRETSVTCLECGNVYKIITAKHLEQHGLNPDAYRHKWGIKADTPLVCKALVRARRKKMKEMQLWERRSAAVAARSKAAEAASTAATPAPAALAGKNKGKSKKS